MAAFPDAVALAWSLLIALPRAREDGKGGKNVSCPTDRHQHGDRSSGLHVSMTESGTVLLHCHAGCDALDILREVGCTPKDLYPDTPERRRAQTKAARLIEAPPDPHLIAIRNAEYEAAWAGWRDGCREVAETIVDSVVRHRRERDWVEVVL